MNHAQATLAALGIPVGSDFHALRRELVDGLLEEADRVHYRQPANANGSRARYFHDRLQRLAQGKRHTRSRAGRESAL
jgi:hypothetical protein